MTRIVLLTLLAVLALPGAAQAARVKIGPSSPTVSEAGVATIKFTNPNGYALRGTTTVRVSGRSVTARSVRLPRKSVTSVTLRFNDKAMDALRAAKGRATIGLRLRRRGGGRSTASRTLTLRVGSGPQQGPAPAPPAPPPTGGTPNTTPPALAGPTRWVGRMGTEGAYDDLELSVDGTRMEITKRPLIAILCLELGSPYGSSLSFELFDAPGPWTIGTDGELVKQGFAVNSLIGSGQRQITYKVTSTAQQAGKITGKLGMSFSGSRYNYSTGTLTIVSCSGSPGFEAIPAT